MRFRLANEKLYVFSYFIGLIAFGSAALKLPGAWGGAGRLSAVDAFFTATSAVCVTGLVTVDTAAFTRFGQSIIMILIQMGGLGLVSFAAVYIATPRSRVSLVNRNIIRDLSVDEIEHNPRRIVGNVVLLTLLIELAGWALMYRGFKAEGSRFPVFEAAFHSISAFCNAGFSTRSEGLKTLLHDHLSTGTIMALVVLGGIGFTVLQDLGRVATRARRRLSYHTRAVLVTTAVLLVGAMTFYYLAERKGAYSGLDESGKLMAAAFQAVTPRTAGFDTISQSALGGASIAFTMILMFIGASPGSTGGGVKTTTVFVALAAAFRNPEAGSAISIGSRQLNPPLLVRAFSILVKAMALVLFSWLALAWTEAEAIASRATSLGVLLFEAVSAFGTVGLSLGVTPDLGIASKIILAATMFAGRVGLFAMAMPRRAEAIERWANFPDASLMIG